MSIPPLNDTSMERLSEVNPLLAAITLRAMQICDVPFQITDGVRSLEDQVENRKNGASKTLVSAHLIGIAVDKHLTRPDGSGAFWEPEEHFKIISNAMKQAAKEFGVSLKWGGDWGWDAVHHQISSKLYGPAIGSTGLAVVNCQRLLNFYFPMPLAVDGHFGPGTDHAVRTYQKNEGLPVTGIVTYATLKKLIPAFERSLP